MSHHVYSTPGFVLMSKNVGEANKFFYIFTRDLGMIAAAAQGIRRSTSKLKPHLQDFSFSVVNVVRGRDVWRVTGAQELSEFGAFLEREHYYRLYVQTLLLLRRLLHGEERHEELFHQLADCFTFLQENDIAESRIGAVEDVLVLNILHSLGYIESKGLAHQFLGRAWSPELVEAALPHHRELVTLINRGLTATGL